MNHDERSTASPRPAPAPTAQDSGPDNRHGPGPQLMGASTLVGNDVYNQDSLDLGDIKEIMLDMRTGHVSYAVLSFGGFMGMGQKLFAVPWDALKLDTNKKCFVLEVKREKLEEAPGFDRNHWPDMADEKWEAGIHAFYGTRPFNGKAPL